MKLFKSQKKKIKISGFTLVETLVAVAVLMIAVAGPLVIASKGLTAALYAKDQMIATMLAQESMEMIKNTRDIGWAGSGWLSGLKNQNCKSNPVSYCDMGSMDPIIGPQGDPFRLYFDPSTGYRNTQPSGSYPSIFYRYFYFEPVSKFTGDCAVDPVNCDIDQKIVHVVVLWKEGTIPFQVELTSLLTNQIR